MDVFVGAQVDAIQIVTHCIGAITPIVNTIRIQEWYDLEHVHMSILE